MYRLVEKTNQQRSKNKRHLWILNYVNFFLFSWSTFRAFSSFWLSSSFSLALRLRLFPFVRINFAFNRFFRFSVSSVSCKNSSLRFSIIFCLSEIVLFSSLISLSRFLIAPLFDFDVSIVLALSSILKNADRTLTGKSNRFEEIFYYWGSFW